MSHKTYFDVLTKRLKLSPTLEGISIIHRWLIDFHTPSPLLNNWSRDTDEKNNWRQLRDIVKKEAYSMLEDEIQSFNPDVLIVHGGTIFNRIPDTVIKIIYKLQEKYPKIRYVLEGRSKFIQHSEEEKYISERRKWAINEVDKCFETDDTIEDIINAIF